MTFFYGVLLTGSECKRDGEQHCLNSTRPPIRPPNGWFMDQKFISSSCKTTASCATRTERLNGWLGALGSSEKVKFSSDYSAFTTHLEISTEKMENFLWDVYVKNKAQGSQLASSDPSVALCRALTAWCPLFKQWSQKAHFNNVLHPEHIWQFSWNVCAAKWSLTLRDRCTRKVNNDFFVFKVPEASGRTVSLFILDTM